MSAFPPPTPPDSPRGGGNPLLRTIVRHSLEERRLPWMRLVLLVLVASVIGIGVGVGVGGLFSLHPTEEQASEAALEDVTAEDAAATDAPVEAPAPEDMADGAPDRQDITVENGDTLASILNSAGLARTEAFEVVETLRPLFDPRALRVGQTMTLVLLPEPADGAEDGPRLASLSLDTDVDRRVELTRGADGKLAATEERQDLTVTLARVTGTIDDSLFASAGRAGLPPTVIADLIAMFSYDVDFQRDIQPGDRFEVLIESHRDTDGRILKWGDILFAKLTLGDGPIPIYRYAPADDGIPDFFDPKGESVRKALLRTPIDGARISSGFGLRRHPVLGYTKMHKGIDFAAPTGTPILAAGDGVIGLIGRRGSYGNYIQLRHDGKYATAYAHLSRFAKGLKPGSRVRQGQTIGYVGTTGRSTGPHLHYEILVDGSQVNPKGVRFQSGRRLTGKELAAFTRRRHEVDALLATAPVLAAMAETPQADAGH
ncbi:M23 family metallopeptidase [Zavarzinia sp.]|uniref:M23 family metallopeptidase n=1 Tax=Zavarzinia sp. TaxID=2027920 RepID=UPI003565F2C9